MSAVAAPALEDPFHGELIRPGDAHYDAVRAVWNGMIDKRPAIVARCTGVQDVIAALRYARGHAVPSRCVAAVTTSPETRCATAAS